MYRPASLENEQLLLRPLTYSDREALSEAASDPLIWEQHPCNRSVKAEFDTYFEESLQSKGALVVVDKAKQKIIGSSRYKMYAEFPSVVEIGWTFLARAYWGGEYNASLKKLMLHYAFGFVDSVLFYVDSNNIRSQKAVGKIGGRPVYHPQEHNLPPLKMNTLLFEIKKAEWYQVAGNEQR